MEDKEEGEFDEEYLSDLLYILIDMTRELIPNLTDEQKAKLDKAQADLIKEA